MELIYGLILIDSLLGVLLVFTLIMNSNRHKEMIHAHADLLLQIGRLFQEQNQHEMIQQEAIFLRLAQIAENTKNLNFKTQLLEMRLDDSIKMYSLAPAIAVTTKQEKVLERRQRSRRRKKPPISRGPKDISI